MAAAVELPEKVQVARRFAGQVYLAVHFVDALGHGRHRQRLHEGRVVQEVQRAAMAVHQVASSSMRASWVVDAHFGIAETPGQAERDVTVGRHA